jgi:hypothetical protein
MPENTNAAESKASFWQDWINRTTAVLAVLAALSSGSWGSSNLRAILEQGKVNDTWAYYQADSIKEHGARQMEGLVTALGKGEPKDRAEMFAKLEKGFAAEAADKDADKKARYEDAIGFEQSRDQMVERGFWFEISFVGLQLGVILCTIATAAKSRALWAVSMLLGLIGLAVFINGIHPFRHAPKSWYEDTSKGMSYEGNGAKSGS